jgi:hypothetical protein
MRVVSFNRNDQLPNNDPLISMKGKQCTISVPTGLPNTSRPSLDYYKQYNFTNEPWWPKFDTLRQRFGIEIIKGDNSNRSRNKSTKQINRNSRTNDSNPPMIQKQPQLQYQQQQQRQK